MFIREEKGAILIMVMLLMLILGIFVATVLPVLRGEAEVSIEDVDHATAKYLAHSGAKVGIDEVLRALETVTNPGSISSGPREIEAVGGKGTFRLSYAPDNAVNPTGIVIRSEGRPNGAGGASYESLVNVWITHNPAWNPNPGVVDLFDNNARYSYTTRKVRNRYKLDKRQEWTIYTDPETKQKFANPNHPEEHSQVFFGDIIGRKFRVTYSATAQSATSGYYGATGYGIYYYASGTPNNPTGYVVQWDPGAYFDKKVSGQTMDGFPEYVNGKLRGCFFVKKNYGGDSIPQTAANNETWDNSSWDYRYSLQNNSGNVETGGNGISRVPFTYVKYVMDKETIRQKLIDNKIYKENQITDEILRQWAIGIAQNAPTKRSERQKLLNVWNPDTQGFQVYNQPHWITIDTTADEINGKLRHQVYIDGVKFLDFVDNTTKNRITQFENTCTGLRVWDCRVAFQNDPSDPINQYTGNRIQWIR